ncbi:MAG TPA: DUF5343 domain-containing protein [Candidatus Saccharimonadales bacterium]|nr:DUF5343 domain-containing protein [Candidatus Saccharimonadales bacterium]
MALPNSYTIKANAIPAYFDALLDAQAPERFSIKFLEGLGFNSTNDRLLIGILKDLGFLNADAAPQQRYFEFLDRSISRKVVADAIREAYAELFAVNVKANELALADVKNKLRTLYTGKKTELVISLIAKTFVALCEYADFTQPITQKPEPIKDIAKPKEIDSKGEKPSMPPIQSVEGSIRLDALQYHINIVLPESRDQAVYDAIFRSLREHLGTRHG